MITRKTKKAETVATILKISEKLFYEQGYENTSISQIAKECSLSKGALYHHFSSKEQVLEKICVNYYQALKDKFLPITQKKNLTMYEKISQIMSFARSEQINTSATTFAKPKKSGTFSTENAILNQLLEKYSQKIYTEIFSVLLAEGKENKECSFPCSAQTVANLIFNLDIGTNERLKQIIFQNETSKQEKMLEDTIDGFVFALAKILNMKLEKIATMILANEMKKIYKKLLKEVQNNED